VGRKVRMMKKATRSLSLIQEYLITKFGVNTSKKFFLRLDGLLMLLSDSPELGRVFSNERAIYSFVLRKQVILFYRFDAKNLIVLEVFDVRRNPQNWP